MSMLTQDQSQEIANKANELLHAKYPEYPERSMPLVDTEIVKAVINAYFKTRYVLIEPMKSNPVQEGLREFFAKEPS